MEDICRQQSCHHTRRNSFSNLETCAISIQSCWSHFKRNRTHNSFKFYIMVEGTTMANTGAIHLTYNRGQHSHRKSGNQKCACCTSTISRRLHTKIFKTEQTRQSYCILQKSSTTADIQTTSWRLWHASIFITDDKDTGLLDKWGMWLEIHPTTCTALRRIMGSCCQINEVPAATNIRFSHCHLWGTFNITCRDRGLSKLQSFVCSIRWSLQPNISVSWAFFKLVNPWPNYLLLTILMLNATDFPGGRSTNNNFGSSGNDGH